jgi:hypothetical protein
MADTATGTLNVVLPLVTGSVGLASGIVLEWLRDKRTYERERVARDDARRDAQLERRNTFQRQTLIELQEAVMNFIRTTGAMNHLDEMAYRESGVWGTAMYPDDLDQNHSLARRQMTMLGVRVRDEEVRGTLQKLKDADAGTLSVRSKQEFDEVKDLLPPAIAAFNDRVGVVLRMLDGVEIAN